MIQEYLLNEISERNAIKEYNPQNVNKRIFSADSENCWYVQFANEGTNENIAKHLSEVDEYIQANFHVTVLTDGSSEYFNNRLYPLVSGFEYKLRKLLYLMSAINHDEKSVSNISDLESKNLADIFSLLFIDDSFMLQAKKEIKNRNKENFSKADVIATIEAIDENTTWDALLGKDVVPTLRKRFNEVRSYRNDIMHSHHMNWARFREVLSAYRVINNELDKAIHDIEIVESQSLSKPLFNKTLNEALRAQEKFSALADALTPIHQLSEIYAQNTALTEAMKMTNISSTAYTALPELQKALEPFYQSLKMDQSISAIHKFQEQMKSIAKIKVDIFPAVKKLHEIEQNFKIPKIEIPPEILRLQSSLSSFLTQDKGTSIDETKDKINCSEQDSDNGEKNDGKNENGNP